MSDFIKTKDGRLGRIYSATRIELLDGEKVVIKKEETEPIQYSKEYSLLVNAVFDLASRVSSLENSQND